MGAASCWRRCAQLPQLTDVASDQQNAAPTASLTIDRDRASSFGISPAMIDATIYDAIGQRQVAQYFTQINSYHVVLEVTPRAAGATRRCSSKLYLTSPITGQQVPLSTFVKVDTTKTALPVDQPPGPVPGGDAVVQPGAGRRARPGGRRDQQGAGADGPAAGADRLVPGHGAGLQRFAAHRSPT